VEEVLIREREVPEQTDQLVFSLLAKKKKCDMGKRQRRRREFLFVESAKIILVATKFLLAPTEFGCNRIDSFALRNF
jgi:hypothetical protein